MSWYYNLILLISCIAAITNSIRIVVTLTHFYFAVKNNKKYDDSVGLQSYLLGASIAYIIWYITKYTI